MRVKDVSVTAASPNGDDYLLLDGAEGGVRKILPANLANAAVLTKNAHGFVVGTPVRLSAGVWVRAFAGDTLAEAVAIAVVSTVPTINTFTVLLQGGPVTGLSGLTPGAIYFLSTVTPGNLVTPSPGGPTGWQVPILRAVSATEAYVEIGTPLSLAPVPSSALAGLQTNAAATPSDSEFFTTKASATKFSEFANALTMPAERITGLLPGEFILGSDDPAQPVIGTFGGGFSVDQVTGVVSLTGGDGSVTQEITGTTINGALGTRWKRAVTGPWTLTSVQIADTVRVSLILTAVGADRTPGWPSNVDWGTAGPPTISAGKSAQILLMGWGGNQISAKVEATGLSIDVNPSALVSVTINAIGKLVLGWSKATYVGTDGITGLVLLMSGGAAGLTLDSGGGTNTWTLSPDRVILGTETGTVSYTKSDDGFADVMGNLVNTVSGLAVDNDSAATLEIYHFTMAGAWPPTGLNGAAGLAHTCAPDLSPGSGRQVLRTNQNGHAPYAEFAAQDDLWTRLEFRCAAQGVPLRIRNGGTNRAFTQFVYDAPNSEYDARMYVDSQYSNANGVPYAPNTRFVLFTQYIRSNPSNPNGATFTTARAWLTTDGVFPGLGVAPTAIRNHTANVGSVNRVYMAPDSTAEFLFGDLWIGTTVPPNLPI